MISHSAQHDIDVTTLDTVEGARRLPMRRRDEGVVGTGVDKLERGKEHASDHAPVSVQLR